MVLLLGDSAIPGGAMRDLRSWKRKGSNMRAVLLAILSVVLLTACSQPPPPPTPTVLMREDIGFGSGERRIEVLAPTTLPPIATIDCEDERFREAVVEIAKFSELGIDESLPRLQELNEDVEEVERTVNGIRCEGQAKYSVPGVAHFTYYVSGTGDDSGRILGLEIGPAIWPPTPVGGGTPATGSFASVSA